MFLNVLTAIHVALSLGGICAGVVLAHGLVTSRPPYRGTMSFLATTAATSATGFVFPFRGVSPAQIVGVLSLILLAVASLSVYRHRLAGGWRKTFGITALIAFYLNAFVLVIQVFQKVPALKAVAPTQSELPFKVTQFIVLVLFVVLGIGATRKTRVIAAG